MASQEGVPALASAILDEARERASQITRAAQQDVDDLLQQAHEAGAARQREILTEAQREAARFRGQTVTAARLEARKLLLERREQLITEALDLARSRLRDGLMSGERRDAIRALTCEAAVALGGGRLTVQANRQDTALLTPDLLRGIGDTLAARAPRCVFEVGPPVDISGGIVASKDEGRVRCDNSFEERLQRRMWTLRNEVWRVLSGDATAGRAGTDAAQGGT